MPRGMNQTTILSHGGRHDAQGVAGTHVKGTVPVAAVLDAIPAAVGTVGNVPESARPGQGPTTRAQTTGEPVAVRRYFDEEGRPDFPPRRGPSTQRPGPETTTKEKVEEAASAPEPAKAPAVAPSASLLPPPSPAATARRDEVSDTPVTASPHAHLDLNKRKLQRASTEQLRAWCAEVGVIPEEYVDSNDQVTGKLMRDLLAEKLDIEM